MCLNHFLRKAIAGPLVLVCHVVLSQQPQFTNPVLDPYDLSKFVKSDAEKFVGDEENLPRALGFNGDGTKMYVVGRDDDAIVEYSLSDPYDISTANHAGEGEEFIFGVEVGNPLDFAFNNDGTKLFVLGSSDFIASYTLSTAYDVSTASYDGNIFREYVGSEEPNPYGFSFNDDGSKLYVTGGQSYIVTYTLTTNFDLLTSSYAGAVNEYYVGDQLASATDVHFSPDGVLLFVAGSIGSSIEGRRIERYELSTPFDITTASYQGFQEGLLPGNSSGQVFNPDGTQLFIIGSGDEVFEYGLSEAISYAELDASSVFDVDANDGAGGGADENVSYSLAGGDAASFTITALGEIAFNSVPDFEDPVDADLDNIYRLTVIADNGSESSQVDISITVKDVNEVPQFEFTEPTSNFIGTTYVGNERSLINEASFPLDMTFSPDGSKMFVSSNLDYIKEYTLPSPYNVVNAMYMGIGEDLYVGDESEVVKSISFLTDGTKMFILDNAGIASYSLSVSFDVSTATYDGLSEEVDVSDEEATPADFKFNSDGTKLFVIGWGDNSVVQYTLSSAYDLSTAVHDGEMEEFQTNLTNPVSLSFNENGLEMYILTQGRSLYTYELQNAYDVSSAEYSGDANTFGFRSVEISAPYDVEFDASNYRLFVLDASNADITEYSMLLSYEYQENENQDIIDVDANDGFGGETDTSVSYLLGGADATHFSVDASGAITWNSTPNFDDPQDDDLDNAYDISLTASNGTEESSKDIQVIVTNLDDTPVFTYIGEGYDITAMSYSGISEELYIGDEGLNPTSLAFNPDGTELFVIGTGDDKVLHYSLSVAYDLNTATLSGVSDELPIDELTTNLLDLEFNDGGTKMYLLTQLASVIEFSLGAPYDISTLTYAGVSEELDVSEDVPGARGVAFSSDGTDLFVVGYIRDEVVRYTLSNAYDISTASVVGASAKFEVDSEFSDPRDVIITADGERFIVSGVRPFPNFGNFLVTYDMGKFGNLSNSTYAGAEEEYQFSGDETLLSNLTFSGDGTKLFGGGDDQSIVEYSLSTIVNYGERRTDNVLDVNANDGVGGEDDTSVSYTLGGDDAALFSINTSGIISFTEQPDFESPSDNDLDNVYHLMVTVANTIDERSQRVEVHVVDEDEPDPVFLYSGEGFDVSTAIYTGDADSWSVSDQFASNYGLLFTPDGTQMFVAGTSRIANYSLLGEFDISSSTYTGELKELDHGDEVTVSDGLAFNDDGSKLFILDSYVVEYTLTSAYDVSSAVHAGESEEFLVDDKEAFISGFTFSADGSKMFIIGIGDKAVVEYSLSTPFDVSTASYAGLEDEFYVGDKEIAPQGVRFNADGTKMYIIGYIDDSVVEYSLSTPYDVSTSSYEGIEDEFYFRDEVPFPVDFVFNPSGTKMFIMGLAENKIAEYRLSSLLDYQENGLAEVIDIEANDGDGGGIDASIAYSLAGDDEALFDISTEGVITFVSSPDYESPTDTDLDNIYELDVVATANTRSSVQSILVTVTDLDEVPPVITLTGENPQEIDFEETYVELGATASDNEDGDISGSIVIDASSVDVTQAGTYTVTYNVSDASGNAAAQVTRTVNILKGNQAIMFGVIPEQNLVDNTTLGLTATGGDSGNPVTYQSSEETIATIDGSTVTFLQPGTVDITASQTGSDNYLDAPDVIQSLTIVEEYIWDGSSWNSGSTPPVNKDILFEGDYSLTGSLESSSTQINSGVTLTIPNDGVLIDHTGLSNAGTLIVESGGSLALLSGATGSDYEIRRNVTGNGGYSIVGSPVEGVTVSDLGADYLYGFDGTSFVAFEGTTAASAGKGFFAGYDISSPSIAFTGTPNTGNQSFSLVTSDQFHLVANPYAAPLSHSALVAGNSSFDGTIYLWDDGGSNSGGLREGGYVTVNAAGMSTGNGGLQGSAAFQGEVGTAQGFFIYAVDNTSVDFTPSMQSTVSGDNADAQFYRVTDYQALQFTAEQGSFKDDLLIVLWDGATEAFDAGLDARKLLNSHFSFYSLLEEQKLAINVVSARLNEVAIPLGYDSDQTDPITFSLARPDQIDPHMEIHLIDMLTGDNYDLRVRNSVTFTVSEEEDPRRFMVKIKAPVLSLNHFSDKLSVHGDATELTLLYSEADVQEEVIIYDMQGRVLFSELVTFNTQKEAIIKLDIKEDTPYLLRLRGESLRFLVKPGD